MADVSEMRRQANGVLAALSARDQARCEGNREAEREARKAAESGYCEILETREARCPGPRSRGLTKRRGLARLSARRPQWRAELVGEVYRRAGTEAALAAAVIALTGARPSEVPAPHCAEIEVSGACITITLRGAKVTSTTGQPWRRWEIETAPSSLAELLRGAPHRGRARRGAPEDCGRWWQGREAMAQVNRALPQTLEPPGRPARTLVLFDA